MAVDQTQIPAARVPIVDANGLVTTQWFRYFYNNYTIAGDGKGVIQPSKGGTGHSIYTDGQLLIGNSLTGGLDKGSITPETGMYTAIAPGYIGVGIADTTVEAGDYGLASKTLTLSVNPQGQLTAVADTDIAISYTQVAGLGTMANEDIGVSGSFTTVDGKTVTVTNGIITNIV